MLPRNSRRALIKILEENGGRLGNGKARKLLEARLEIKITQEDFNHLKEQLLSSGSIKKAQGRGGAIEIIPSTPRSEQESSQSINGTKQKESVNNRIDNLITSLRYLPGARVKQNKRTITLLCGDDNDKLYCGWEETKDSYFIQYRVETGRDDRSDLAEKLFYEAISPLPTASVQRLSNFTTAFVGENVAQCNRVVKRLMALLEDVTLDNAPQQSGTTPTARADSYFNEIASLIRYCTENSLRWPLKNWRKTLGFDDVDDLVVIGSSPSGAKTPYREHVVPACLIKEEAIRMAEEGAPTQAIADFIQHHLYVVIISPEEAKILNSGVDQGGISVKTTMPEGWIFGDDPTERLLAAGIQINYIRPIPLPEWKQWRPTKRSRVRDLLLRPIGMS